MPRRDSPEVFSGAVTVALSQSTGPDGHPDGVGAPPRPGSDRTPRPRGTEDHMAGYVPYGETEYASLQVTRDGHVAEVTLTGPGRGNAMGPDFWRECPQVFAALDADPQIRAVVLSWSGGHFTYVLELPYLVSAHGVWYDPGSPDH